jgi:uncharacterized BrkB/YihY/UPF0761 family membrane protein
MINEESVMFNGTILSILWTFGIFMTIVGSFIILTVSIVLIFRIEKCDDKTWNGYTWGIACLILGIINIVVPTYLLNHYTQQAGT